MNNISKACPDQQTLLQFIQGRLEPPTLDQCENHVSGCESCHETLRGLDANDTLSHYVSEALEQPLENQSDTKAIDGLMQRLLQPTMSRRSNSKSNSDTQILADRAAEVLRCVEPAANGDEDSLGTLGDYRLLQLLGAGGTGVVFQAMDVSLNRVVALKVLRPSLGETARNRFIAEAQLAASIEHDNVVTIYQIGQEGRLGFIAMQWLPGETLETRLNREPGLLDEATVREFVSQIASGLSAAHQRQLIHRDIKPANIWICEDTGRIKILDFGLARIADEESSLTQTGMLAGTPNFMSPEQARGMELDPRSDLFSLGCVMFLLLTGRLPFSASTVLGTLQTIQSDSPPPPISVNPQCNRDLSDLTMSLLEKLPGNRLASAENLISSLSKPRSQWPQKITKVQTETSNRNEKPQVAGDFGQSKSGGMRWLIAAGMLGMLCVTGWLMAPQIFRIVTDQGELIIETSDENIKIEVLESGNLCRVLDTSTNNSFDIKSGEYSFNVVSEDNQSKFEVTPKSVTMTRGSKQLVTVTISQSETSEEAPVPNVASGEVPVYRGRNFAEWRRVAEYDRDPRTIADAIAACATLAGADQKEEFLELFRKLIRKHGAAHCQPISVAFGGSVPSDVDVIFTGFVTAMNYLGTDEIVDFMQTEIEQGNDRSLGFFSSVASRLNHPIKPYQLSSQLDLSPLLQRVNSRELKINSNVDSFLSYALESGKADLDLELTRAFLKGRDLGQYSWLYSSFMKNFSEGELDDVIEANFFDPLFDGETRIAIISSLETRLFVYHAQNGTGGIWDGYGGGGYGGGYGGGSGFENSLNSLPINHALLNRILTNSIMKIVNTEDGLAFGKNSEFWYYAEGAFEPQSGYSSSKPNGTKSVTGKVAIIRYLLNGLCKSVREIRPQGADREHVLSFANQMVRSSALQEIYKPNEELKIAEDIKALIEAVNGDGEKDDFSKFVPLATPQGPGAFRFINQTKN